MSLVDAALASESPTPANYLGRLEVLVERLLAALAPHEALAFLWGIFLIYLALLATWRLDHLCQRLIDQNDSRLPPPPELPFQLQPQPAEHHAAGAAGAAGD
ncbi:hypothetical protein N7491_009949 [Penicillium cf. griseofulvum]|uniref:Uncharacterized protein n=1 Tax=Penicillium cf. griseofulvum TaxID=2972120 RepID=A0A9W9T5M2_9EURO|nr:hypothetical protein N7472_000280 [Penicillium cf. griseofulvum]KAJ5421504.1 hypothetical protein N7491_009949 [Penicillium cf. griseofulvum]KAJ5424737.1 hypothetical protein N7445_010710 [Penicillium cf. griseofulvum]